VIKRYDSRAGRKLSIYQTLYTLNRSFTMYQIADLMHLARSSHLNKILLEMVNDGDLAYYEVAHRPNSTKRLYYVRALAESVSQTSLAI